MTDTNDKSDGDEQWLKREIERRVGQLWMQQGDPVRETPEDIERDVRSPGYRARAAFAEAMAKREGVRSREIMERVKAEAAALGIEDYTALVVKAWEEDKVLRSFKQTQ